VRRDSSEKTISEKEQLFRFSARGEVRGFGKK
jgi:hypothetical protein